MVNNVRTVVLGDGGTVTIENNPEQELIIIVKDSDGKEVRVYLAQEELKGIRDCFMKADMQKTKDDVDESQ